jgi:hypothetical protein
MFYLKVSKKGESDMSKSKLRTEYEARFGVVEGHLRLYDAKGNTIYHEYSNGCWVKRDYDAESNQIYRENSWSGVALDDRPCSGKVFIEQKTGKKFKMTEIE